MSDKKITKRGLGVGAVIGSIFTELLHRLPEILSFILALSK